LAVIVLGVYNISNASRIVFPANDTIVQNSAAESGDVQIINTAYRSGSDISPKQFTVKVGQPVKFLVDVKDEGSGCMSTIMIPGLYNKPLFLEKGSQLSLEFTPSKKGTYPITCAMGIKRGTLTVE
jgi:plastocyanin domain-containing protein